MDDLNIAVQATIDIPSSRAKMNSDLKKIKLDAVKVGLEFDNKATVNAVNSAKKQLQSGMQKLQTEAKNYIIAPQLKEIEIAIDKGSEKLIDNLTDKFKELQNQADKTSSSSSILTGIIDKGLNVLGNSKISTFAKAGYTDYLKEMINNIIKLDEVMVDLQMTTGGTDGETAQMLKTYNAMAQELGANTTEVAQNANAWLKQGKTQTETEELIRASMVLSRLCNMESAQATEYLTSVMQGYNLSAREAIGIVDKLTAVNLAGVTPIDGMAQALAETAQSADTVGVSMDKLVGYMAVTGEATQKSMNSIGESYSSIFERMSNIQAGKLFDESTGEDLSDVEDSLSAVGIQLRDSEESFKDFGNVIDEIASKWDNYNEAEQNTIATAIAGAGQQGDFVALMENYGDALSYAGSAADSSGAALARYESYQDGIEGKTKALAASFEELSMSLINSDIVKLLVDIARGFIEILNAGDGIIPQFAMVIAGASGIVNALSALGSSKIAGGTKVTVPVKYARHTPVVTLNEWVMKKVLSIRVYERIS